jgi:Type II intron maturase
VQLRVPRTVIKAKSAPYLKCGKPAPRPGLKDRDDHAIISIYGAEYRGLVQYYLLANDVWRLNRLEWAAKTSMLKTLAWRHRTTVTKIARKHTAVIATPHGPRRCFEARVERDGRKPLVARFGGIPLRRQRTAVIDDDPPPLATTRRKELITRLLAGRCELCEQQATTQVHQVRKLADLTGPGGQLDLLAGVQYRQSAVSPLPGRRLGVSSLGRDRGVERPGGHRCRAFAASRSVAQAGASSLGRRSRPARPAAAAAGARRRGSTRESPSGRSLQACSPGRHPAAPARGGPGGTRPR